MTGPKNNKKKGDEFIRALNVKEHAGYRFCGCDTCTMCCDGSTYTCANVLLDEMFDTAKLFPVVFSISEEKKITLMLLYTFAKGVPCPYLDMKSRLCLVYDSIRPRACKVYPFNIKEIPQPAGRNLSYAVVFDSRCPGIREGGEGLHLIDTETGRFSKTIGQNFISERMLREYKQNLKRTQEFLDLVKAYDLLVEQQYNIVDETGDQGFYGQNSVRVWQISEEKLAALPQEAVMKLHQKQFFNAIYTHLNSLGNIHTLLKRKKEFGKNQVDILSFRI